MSNSERGGGEAIVKSVPSMHVQLRADYRTTRISEM